MITSLEDFKNNVIYETNFERFKDTKIKCINVDEVFTKGHSIVDIIFYFRVVGEPSGNGSREPVTKPIICTGFLPPEYLIRKDPQFAILYSPGVMYVQLPKDYDVTKTLAAKLPDFDATLHKESMKPFLKLRVDKLLAEFRHSYSNYTGMLLYLMKIIQDTNGIKLLYEETYLFLKSLEYHILSFYFSLSSVDLKGLINVNQALSKNKKVMLVDDLSEAGWDAIVRHMVYGSIGKKRTSGFSYVSEPESDYTWEETIERKIKDFKPHLLLLDLRLEGEKGKQNLEDLQGYKILKYLKNHAHYKGIPVIIFTASTNAENVKKLLKMGAEAVWTKPGLDEGLSANTITKRYNQLVTLIENILAQKQYKDLRHFNDGTDPLSDALYLQNLLLNKLDYVKYRYRLVGGKNVMELKLMDIAKKKDGDNGIKISDFQFIYFDNNALMSGYWQMSFEKLICSLMVLSMSVKDSTIKLKDQNNATNEYTVPKVVVMNVVYDELIKKAKVLKNQSKPKQCMRASTALLILKGLFDNGFVRSEIRGIDESGNPIFFLANPKENVYADPFLLDEMFNITQTKEGYNFHYETNQKVLFITGDKNLTDKLKVLQNVYVLKPKDFADYLHKTLILE